MEISAIVGGTVVDGTGRPPLPDAVVLLAGERIANVVRRGEIALPADARVLEAFGATVLPGLIDCHAHVGAMLDNSSPDLTVADPLEHGDRILRRFVAHGVTTVRDPGVFDPDRTLRLLKRGRPAWPRFFGAGPILDGPGDPSPRWRWLTILDDPAAARQEVRRLARLGVDFLKVYVRLRHAVLAAVVLEAHGLGLPVAAHVGHAVSVEEAVRLGVDALEHVRIGRELVAPEDRRALDALPTRAMDPVVSFRAWRHIDPASEAADRLIELLAERGVFLTPTLTLSRSILAGDLPETLAPPGIDDLPEAVRAKWRAFTYSFDYTPEDFTLAKVELARQMEFVGRAQRGGVRITAGTDTQNPYVVPGSGLHEELALLVACGLSPMEALVAATGRAAELLGRPHELGSVQKGRFADLVIVDGDPLRDVESLRRVRAVVKAGRVVATASPPTAPVRAAEAPGA